MGRRIKVPKENRRVATVSRSAQSSVTFLTLTDSINNFADHVSVVSPTSNDITVSDFFALADSISIRLGVPLDLADSVLIGDQFSLGFGLAITDGNSLSDAIQAARGLLLEVNDSFTLSDA